MPINTTKGLFEASITRNALVETARIGKTVRSIATASPLGLTLTAASLVCELTNICKDLAGNWMISENPTLPGYPPSISAVGYYFVAGINSVPYRYPSPEVACSAAASKDKFWGDGYTGAGSGTGPTACTRTKTSDGSTLQTSITYSTDSCPEHYSVSGTSCVLSGATPQTPTAAQWDSKESLLNDNRFTPELLANGSPVPVGTINLPSVQTIPIDKRTTTLRDGSGNVTGTEEATTEAKIEAPSSGENPTGNPNLIKVTETTTVINYNTNNQITNQSTTVSDGAERPPVPQSFEIEIDNMTDQPLEQQPIPGTFTATSWGSGSCPADRSVDYHYGSLTLTFQPACDAAVMANPVILAIAGLAAMFIITGAIRND